MTIKWNTCLEVDDSSCEEDPHALHQITENMDVSCPHVYIFSVGMGFNVALAVLQSDVTRGIVRV